MIGRAAYQTPWLFSDMDRRYYGVANPGLSRKEILYEYADYADSLLDECPHRYSYAMLIKPIINMFTAERHQKIYRRMLSDSKHYKQFDCFSDSVKSAVEVYEKMNPKGMNLRAPMEDPRKVV
jgi:tRNA-dihydrouridine synthase A